MKHTSLRRGIATMLSLLMIFSAVPQSAYASTDESPDVSIESVVEETHTVEETEGQDGEELMTTESETEQAEAQAETSAEAETTQAEDNEATEAAPPGETQAEESAQEESSEATTPEETVQDETSEAETAETTEEQTTSEVETEAPTTEQEEEAKPLFSEIATDSVLSAEQLGAIDFSSKRLLVAGPDDLILDPENVLSSYDGVHLLQYADEQTARNAYSYYYGKATFVDVDSIISVATGEGGAAGSSEMAEDQNPIAELAAAVSENPGQIKETVVALIDTGVNGNDNIIEAVSMLGDDTSDANGHGTRMAELMREQNPDIKIISIKALGADGTGDASAVYAAIQYAKERGADIINLSISAPKKAENAAVANAIAEAQQAGIKVVAAAGNQGNNASYYIPGGLDGVITIGAADEKGERLASSNYGSAVDFNVIASSTSEATAIYSGLLSAGKGEQDNVLVFAPDYKNDEGTEPAEDEPFDFNIQATRGAYLGDGIYQYDFGSDSSGVFIVLTNLVKSKSPNTTVYVHGIAANPRNAANVGMVWDSATSVNGVGSAVVNLGFSHIWKNEKGQPVYCYDYATDDVGARHPVTFEGLSDNYVNKARLQETYRMALAFTQNNFALLKRVLKANCVTFQTKYCTVTPDDIYNAITASNDTMQSLVQLLVWTNMHQGVLSRVVDIDVYIPGNWMETKEGPVYNPPTVWLQGARVPSFVNLENLIGIGIENGGSDVVPDKGSSGDTPGDIRHPGASKGQLLILTYKENGYLKARKTSNSTAVTNNNSCYDLSGVKFEVFNDPSCSAASKVTKDANGATINLVTGSDGYTNTIELADGTYYVREVKSTVESRGWIYNPTPEKAVVSATSNDTPAKAKVAEVKNNPKMDPIGLLLLKVDKQTGKEKPQGDMTLEGAQYEVKFYPNLTATGTPARTWMFKTDANGYFRYSNNYKVSGPDLYVDSDNVTSFPLGSVTIQEKSAPTGYAVNNTIYKFKIQLDSNNKPERRWLETPPAVTFADGTQFAPKAGDKVSLVRSGNTLLAVNAEDVNRHGNLTIDKKDIQLEKPYQADAKTQGIRFAVVNASQNSVMYKDKEYEPNYVMDILVMDINGQASTPQKSMPYGTYKVYELREDSSIKIGDKYVETGKSIYANGQGYLYKVNSDTVAVREDGKTYKTNFTDNVARGDVKFVKVGAEKEVYNGTELAKGQGDATLKGAEITIYNDSEQDAVVRQLDGSAKTVKKGEVAIVLTTDENGQVSTTNGTLPYGTYHAVETKPSKGYLLNKEWRIDFQIREDGVTLDTTNTKNLGADKTTVLKYVSGQRKLANGKLPEEVIRGGVTFKKIDAETQGAAQGDATLANAEIGIYNLSKEQVYVTDENGTARWVEPNQKVLSVFTDENGKAKTEDRALPYGTYKAVELHPSNGYLTNDGWYVIFQIREDGVIVKTEDPAFYDANGASKEKSCYYEYVSGDAKYSIKDLGNATLQELPKRNDLTWEKLNIDGLVKEKIPFAIDRMEEKNGQWVAVETHVIVSDEDGVVNTGAAFVDRSKINVLDQYVKNGVFSPDSKLDPTASVWFGNQNASNDAKASRGALVYGTYRIRELQCGDNVVNHEDLLVSELITVHDDYVMKGKTETTQKVELLSQNTRVFGYHALIDLEVELKSVLTDKESYTHSVPCREAAVIEDVVHYTHLKETSKYVMKADLVISGTNEKVASVSQPFSPERSATSSKVQTAEGDITLTFNVDTRPYEGKKLTSMIYLYEVMNDANGEYEVLIQKHNTDTQNIDLEQEVAVPTMVTHAIDTATGDHVGAKRPNKESNAQDVIRDTVELRNLAPQEQYSLVAVLVNRETGEKIAEAEKYFTAKRSPDNDRTIHYVDMTDSYIVTIPDFKIDASKYKNQTLVIFETLYRVDVAANGEKITQVDKPILTHISKMGQNTYDLNEAEEFRHHNGQFDDNKDQSRWYESYIDEEQSVHYVDLKTTATDGDTDDHVGTVKDDAVINDIVELNNLIPGMEYTLKGTLVYQSDCVDSNGKAHKAGEAVAYKNASQADLTFTASKTSEKHTLTYVLDASILENVTVVVFEDLYHNNVLISWHNDLEDESQSIHYPKIRTAAVDKMTGDDVGTLTKNAEIIDTVSYDNLIVGQKYTISGVLMDQKTGKPLLVNGKQVTATSEEFVATKTSGTKDLHFTFDSSALEDTTAVVFEKLYHPNAKTQKPVEVTRHEDITDKGQTIHFPKVRTNAVDSRTGDHVGSIFGALINTVRGWLGEEVEQSDKQQIIDTVSLWNLVPGRTYTVNGILMNQDTGEKLLVDGNEVKQTATITVTADGKITAANGEKTTVTNYDKEHNDVDGTVALTFTLDSSLVQGVTVVAYEDLIHNNVKVAFHNDIKDNQQSVNEVEIHTTAVDAKTGDHVGDTPRHDYTHESIADEATSTINDTVNMAKLVKDMEYTVKGVLVVKEDSTGAAPAYLKADGTTTTNRDEAITAEKTFVANATDLEGYKVINDFSVSGSVKLSFTVSSQLVEGKTIVVFEDLYHNDVKISTHSDLEDEAQSVHYPKIRTNASDVNTKDDVAVVGKTTVEDKVTYENLIESEEYVIKGHLVYQEDCTDKDGKAHKAGETVLSPAGKAYEASVTLAPGHAKNGSETLKFEIDSSVLEGATIVAFERLEHKNVLVTAHANIKDDTQTEHFPKIRTSAIDGETKDNVGTVEEDATIIDTVTYTNLRVGRTYTISGVVHQRDNVTGKDMGELLDSKGNRITAEITFVAGEENEFVKVTAINNSDNAEMINADDDTDRVDGTVTLTFKLDSSKFADDVYSNSENGITAVVFEKLFHADVEVAQHEDINDEGQTIHYPKIRTSAVDDLTKDEVGSASKNAANDETDRLRDSVQYWNLVPGKEYNISGRLMNKDTGKEVIIDGKNVVQSRSFTAGTAIEDGEFKYMDADKTNVSGSIDLVYSFEAKTMRGITTVVFEKLHHNDVKVTEHEDINDKEQTIHYPEIHTTASDGKTQDHVGTVEKEATIIDVVHFTDLVKGKEYTLEGTIHTRNADGTDGGILVDSVGKEIKASKTFIAGDADDELMTITKEEEINGRIRVSGTYTLTFELDSSLLEGETVVAFENLKHNDIVVDVHADISDEEQAIHYPKIRTNAVDVNTNDSVGSIIGRLVNFFLGREDTDKQVIVDTVSYWNLIPGMTYEVSGTLMNKDTEEAIQEADAPVTIKATKADGTVAVNFTVDSAKLTNANAVGGGTGISTVVFEKLYHGVDNKTTEDGKVHPEDRVEVTRHEDLNDEDQSVNEVGVRTTAVDKETEDHVGAVPSEEKKTVTIVDTVELSKLVRGMRYKVTGVLVDQTLSTDKNIVYLLDKNGEKITSQATVVVPAEGDFSQDSTAKLEFVIDNELVQGKAVTVFESVWHNDIEIGIHQNIHDASQTVYYPTGKTNATDNATSAHVADAAEKTVITDDVYFQNLILGEEYTIKGQLMVKSTGKALEADGAAVSVSFTPAEEDFGAHDVIITEHKDGTKVASGYMPIVFTIDTSALAGETVVTFETFEHKGIEIYVHADLEDLPQNVKIPKIGTMAYVDELDEAAIKDQNNNYKDIIITDTVSYKNLWTADELAAMKEQGKTILNGKVADLRDGMVYTINDDNTYTIVGVLMDKATGEILLNNDGEPVYGKTTFQAKETEGTVKVEFLINAGDYVDEETGESRIEGATLVVFEDLYYGTVENPAEPNEDDHIAEHKDIEDDAQDIRLPKGRTHALGNEFDETDAHAGEENPANHEVLASEDMTITDVVTYENLHGGTEYVVTGRLMDKATGEAMKDDEGNEIVEEVPFTTEGEYEDHVSGTVTIEFKFSGVTLAGKTTVAFETITREGQEVIVHADINDDAQTVHIPEIKTTAWGINTPEDFHEALASKDEKVTIFDKVEYTNLRKGYTYKMSGILMDKKTGEPILVDGKPVTAEAEFVAGAEDKLYEQIQNGIESDDVKAGVGELPTAIEKDGWDYEGVSGTVTLAFTFDASALEGETAVAFEDLYNGEKLVAIHHDIEDEDQTVTFPKVRTTASGKDSEVGLQLAEEKATVIDVVKYNNLHVGEEYEVRGVLMNKATGEELKVNGKVVEATAKFTPKEADGEVELAFEFDASLLAGETLVAFEKLYRNDILVGIHADLEDEDQTVHIPEIETNAKDVATGDHNGHLDEQVKIEDEVTFKNLIPGKTYTMTGTLMVKETGKELLVDGKPVTVTKEFTPEEADGSVVLEFVIDSRALAGQTVVAFEDLKYNGVTVGLHADINDEDQSVHFPEIGTRAADKQSGTQTMTLGNQVILIDTVSYKNLIPGKEYTVKGEIMDKATGKSIGVTAEAKFTAPDAKDGEAVVSGEMTVEFTLNTNQLQGKSLVVFEKMYDAKGNLIAAHEDINDAEQTVKVPAPPTTPPPVKTGDDTNIFGWLALLMGSAAAAFVILVARRRRKEEAR